jgi:hypothetical protein
MPTAHIGSSTAYLSLALGSRQPASGLLTASLQLDGLAATVRVDDSYANRFQDLSSFFAALEKSWRGWKGAQSWESVEGNLRVEARHEYGKVRLTVAMRRDRAEWDNHGWHATGDLTIEPGEQLSRIAREVAELAR